MRLDERTLLQKVGMSDVDRKSGLHDRACRYLAQPGKLDKILSLVPYIWASKGQFPETVDGSLKIVHDHVETISENKNDFEHLYSKSCVYSVKLGQPVYQYSKIVKEQYKGTIVFDLHVAQMVDLVGEFSGVAYRYAIEERKYRPSDLNVHPWIDNYGYSNDFVRGRVVTHGRFDPSVIGDAKSIAATRGEFTGEKVFTKILGTAMRLAVVEVKSKPVEITEVMAQMNMYKKFNIRTQPDTSIAYILATCYPISVHEKGELSNHGIQHIYLCPDMVNEWFDSQMKAQVKEESF